MIVDAAAIRAHDALSQPTRQCGPWSRAAMGRQDPDRLWMMPEDPPRHALACTTIASSTALAS